MPKRPVHVSDPIENNPSIVSPGRASRADGGYEPPSPTARTAAASPMVSPGRGPVSMHPTAFHHDVQRSQTASHHSETSSHQRVVRHPENVSHHEPHQHQHHEQQQHQQYDSQRQTSSKSNPSYHGSQHPNARSHHGDTNQRSGNRLLERDDESEPNTRPRQNSRALGALVSQNQLLEQLQSGKGPQQEEELKKLQHRMAQADAVTGVRGYGAEPATSMKHYHRQRLIDFYLVYNPAQLSTVEKLLQEFEGREYRFFSALEYKYGPEPSKLPPAVCSRLFYLTHSKDFDPEEFRKLVKDRPFEPLFGHIIVALAYDAALSGELKTIEAKQLELDLIHQMDMQEQAYGRQVNRNSRRTTLISLQDAQRKSTAATSGKTTAREIGDLNGIDGDDMGEMQMPAPYAGRLGSVEPNRMGVQEMMHEKRTQLLSSATSLLTDTDALKYISAATREMTTKPLPDHLNTYASSEEEAYSRMYYSDLRMRLHQYLSMVNPKAIAQMEEMITLVKQHKFRESDLWQELYALYGTGAKESCEPRRSVSSRSSSAGLGITAPIGTSVPNTPRRRPWEHSAVFATTPIGQSDGMAGEEGKHKSEEEYEKKMEYARKEHARRHANALQEQRWHMLIRMKLNDIQQIQPIMQFSEVDASTADNDESGSLLNDRRIPQDSGLLDNTYVLMLPDHGASFSSPANNTNNNNNNSRGDTNMNVSFPSAGGMSYSGMPAGADGDFVQRDANNSSMTRWAATRSNRSNNETPPPITEWSTLDDLCTASKKLEEERKKKDAEKPREAEGRGESRRRASRNRPTVSDTHKYRQAPSGQSMGTPSTPQDPHSPETQQGEFNTDNDRQETAPHPDPLHTGHDSMIDSSGTQSYRSTKFLPNKVSVDHHRKTIAYAYPDSNVDRQDQEQKANKMSVRHVDFMQRVPTRMHSREFEQYMALYTSSSTPQERVHQSPPKYQMAHQPTDESVHHRTQSSARTPTPSAAAGTSGRVTPSSRRTPHNHQHHHHHPGQTPANPPLIQFSARDITPTMRSVSASTGVSATTAASRMRGYSGPSGVGVSQQHSPNPTARTLQTPTDRTMRYEDLFGVSGTSASATRTSPSRKTISTTHTGSRGTKVGIRPSRKSEEVA